MRRLAAAVLLALVPCALAQDGPAGPAFVEVVSTRDTYYVGESFVVTIVVGVEAQFLATRAVQPFRRELEVPVQIDAPWFDDPAGLRRLAIRGVRAGSGRKLALNERVTSATPLDSQEIGGRRFAMFDVDRRFVATATGALTIPPPQLRLAYATRFEETFVEGRVPLDRRDVTVDGAGLTVTIVPLPEAGRPDAFTGAVGRCSVSAEIGAESVDVGGTVQLTLHIDGGAASVVAPRLDELDGLHVLGMIESGRKGGRTFTYDLRVLGTVDAVPAIPFAFFDPAPPGQYRVVSTEAIPLSVQGSAERPDPIPAPAPSLPGRGWGRILGALSVLLAAVAAMCFGVRWYARRSRPTGGAERDPRAELHDALVRRDADPADALAGYLGAQLRCAPAAVVSPDLAERLTAAGVAPSLAGRVSRALERLVAARYGGGADDDVSATVRGLVDELDPAFTSRT